jgi:para-nitrobenzyl esterase
LVLASAAVAAQPSAAPAVEVRVEGGWVRGPVANGVASWKSIPYAAPPIGPLRWRSPQPVQPWSEVRDASRFGPACPQADVDPTSEDCLTLNVFRPAAASAKALPVMVWIHGGAQVRGSASIYPGNALAAKGVIVVTLNYRLGRLGFFAHPALAAESPAEARGNYGYLDQRAALQWVQRNIAWFGGDPGQVTIFGESAGGGSVLAHLVSPMSRGLFHRAILQSPGTPGPRAGAIPSTDLAVAEQIAADWARSEGVVATGAAALQQLRALPIETLLAGASGPETIAALVASTVPPGMAMSIIDGRFLVERPEAALAAGRFARVPVIIGANDRDLPIGDAFSKDALFARFGSQAELARRLYDPLGVQDLSELKQQVFADGVLVEPTRHVANVVARHGQPVWLYRFAYVSESQRGDHMGTLHGFEIPFTLNVPAAMVGDKVTPTDKAMADLVSDYWAALGRTGNPNGRGRPAWPKHDPKLDRLLHFTNSGPIVGTDPLKPRLDLWERARRQGP